MKLSGMLPRPVTGGTGDSSAGAARPAPKLDGKDRGVRHDETLDRLFQGRLKVRQSRDGYRFSLDSVLLAQFAAVGGFEQVADLGAGNGVIALALACLNPSTRVTGIEIQPQMVARACANVRLNGFEKRVVIRMGDVRDITRAAEAETFDAVVCNPPFRKSGSGRLNPNREKQIARHEIMGLLNDFLGAGAQLLRVKGRLNFIYPAARSVELLASMRTFGTEPKRVRMVHSFRGAPASLILAEAVKGARSGVEILPPLMVYEKDKKYTSEMESMLRGPCNEAR